ncbi:MAG: universal stress protein [Syntrophobacteraceae bacterium]|nr:universal stress protein [Syntrophobacteraceae bacterium]
MQKVLIAADGTQKGLEMVSVLGRLLKEKKDVKVLLFHCVQQVSALLPEDLCMDVVDSCRLSYDSQERLGQAVLKASAARLSEAGFPEQNVELRLKIESVDPAGDIIAQADIEGIRTVAVGRRGRRQVEALLLGSVSAKVAQSAGDKVVWVVDPPVNDSMNVLIAMEGTPEARALSDYAAEFFAGSPGFSYSFIHVIPPLPPEFWDDGHILNDSEQEKRRARIEKWKADWTGGVERCMSQGRNIFAEHGADPQKVQTLILPTREGIARDLLTEIEAHKFRIVVMGRKSFREKKPFALGSHAAKILQNSKGVILCLVS